MAALRSREREPIDWARAQNNLGNALQVLGQRDKDNARLEEAVAIYRSFQGDDGKEPIVRRRQAQAEFRVGTAYLSLADYVRAGEAIATAEGIQTQLRNEYPSDPEYYLPVRRRTLCCY